MRRLLITDQELLRLIRRMSLETTLRRAVEGLDRLLRRWPWLYKKLGGEDSA